MKKIMEAIKKLFKSKSMKYGSNSVIMVIAVIAIAVLINVLVGMIPATWDLTSNKLFSIGDTTKEILDGVTVDVQITGLFDETTALTDSSYKEIDQLLKQYEKYSSHIKLNYVDPDKNPGYLKEIDPNGMYSIAKNDFVIKTDKKIKSVTPSQLYDSTNNASVSEQTFTGAIKYVTAEKTPTVYFLSGHEEMSIESDYGVLKGFLDRNNYDTKTISLATEPKVPDDAETVVIAAPKRDLTTDEANRLKDYLANGGKVVFLFDSLELDVTFTEFEKILRDYNISLNYDKVKENDGDRHVPNNDYDLLPNLEYNEINASGLDAQNFVMIMPKSRSLNVLKNENEYLTVTQLLTSSEQSVGEQIDKSKGRDIAGPLTLAVAAEDKSTLKPSKVLVIGNGYFISDTAVNQYEQYSRNGMYFFLNSLGWMQDREDDVIIASKSYEASTMTITETQARVIAICTVFGLPLLILGFGTFVWMRRRHL